MGEVIFRSDLPHPSPFCKQGVSGSKSYDLIWGRPMPRNCIFCSTPLKGVRSEEHAIPRWLMEYLGITERSTVPSRRALAGRLHPQRSEALRREFCRRPCLRGLQQRLDARSRRTNQGATQATHRRQPQSSQYLGRRKSRASQVGNEDRFRDQSCRPAPESPASNRVVATPISRDYLPIEET